MARFCHKCGNEIIEEGKFCAKCGAKLNIEKKPVPSDDDNYSCPFCGETIPRSRRCPKCGKSLKKNDDDGSLKICLGILVVFIFMFLILLIIFIFTRTMF